MMSSVKFFSGMPCLDGTFTLQVKEGSEPYKLTPEMVAYALLEPLKEELERLQGKQVIVPLALMRHLNGVTASC